LLRRYYAPDYAVLLALTAALCVSEYTEPYQRYIYHDSDVVRADLDGPLIPSKHPARFWM
jgi:hypothetical protein